MYNALVMLYFNYCSAVWGDINIKKLADKLQKMQNRAARILSPFPAMMLAQVFCWMMSLVRKGWKM